MRAARVAALCALTVTLVAAPLSAAAFTPAVFMSMLATLVAAATAALGETRISALAAAVALVTVLFVSPIDPRGAGALLLALPFVMAAVGLWLGWAKPRSR